MEKIENQLPKREYGLDINLNLAHPDVSQKYNLQVGDIYRARVERDEPIKYTFFDGFLTQIRIQPFRDVSDCSIAEGYLLKEFTLEKGLKFDGFYGMEEVTSRKIPFRKEMFGQGEYPLVDLTLKFAYYREVFGPEMQQQVDFLLRFDGVPMMRKVLLKKPLDEYQLSRRTANSLANLGIENLGQLTEYTEKELLKTKNFGKASLSEIKNILTIEGFELNPLDEYQLSVRAANALANRGIENLGQLTEYTEKELLKTKNFGKASLNEIKRILSHKDLELKK